MGIVLAILIFCVIIIIHELGHFTAAKLFKMRVYEFSLGLGPILFSREKNGTVYAIKAIPFGGSVQLGEDEYDKDDKDGKDDKDSDKREADKADGKDSGKREADKADTQDADGGDNDRADSGNRNISSDNIGNDSGNTQVIDEIDNGKKDTDNVSKAGNNAADLFVNKPLWQRAIVIAAGAFMNLVLGLIVCTVIAATSQYIVTTTVVSFRDGVTDSSFMPGDSIIAINGMRVYTDNDIWYKLSNSNAEVDGDGYANFNFTVKRDGKTVSLPNVKWKATSNEGHSVFLPDFYVGVVYTSGGLAHSVGKIKADTDVMLSDTTLTAEQREAVTRARDERLSDLNTRRVASLPDVVSYGFYSTVSYARIVWLTLADLLRGTYGLNDLSGPVGTVTVMDQSTRTADGGRDYTQLLPLAAFMTINIGIFNLLPIPALDGGRLFFFAVEAVRRKPINPRYESAIHFAGFALLLLLMAIITFKDIGSIVFG